MHDFEERSLNSVFVFSEIVKVSVSVISLSLGLGWKQSFPRPWLFQVSQKPYPIIVEYFLYTSLQFLSFWVGLFCAYCTSWNYDSLILESQDDDDDVVMMINSINNDSNRWINNNNNMSFLLNSLILRSDQSQGETKIQNYIL